MTDFNTALRRAGQALEAVAALLRDQRARESDDVQSVIAEHFAGAPLTAAARHPAVVGWDDAAADIEALAEQLLVWAAEAEDLRYTEPE